MSAMPTYAEILARLRDLRANNPASLADHFVALGFAEHDTGGCTAYVRRLADGLCLVTQEDDDGIHVPLDTRAPWGVGLYGDDMQYLNFEEVRS